MKPQFSKEAHVANERPIDRATRLDAVDLIAKGRHLINAAWLGTPAACADEADRDALQAACAAAREALEGRSRF